MEFPEIREAFYKQHGFDASVYFRPGRMTGKVYAILLNVCKTAYDYAHGSATGDTMIVCGKRKYALKYAKLFITVLNKECKNGYKSEIQIKLNESITIYMNGHKIVFSFMKERD